MDDFERRLRESMNARAEDVEPTPELWQSVERRIARRRWLTWGAYGLATAAVAALAVVVIPSLINDPDVFVGQPPGDGATCLDPGAGITPTDAPLPSDVPLCPEPSSSEPLPEPGVTEPAVPPSSEPAPGSPPPPFECASSAEPGEAPSPRPDYCSETPAPPSPTPGAASTPPSVPCEPVPGATPPTCEPGVPPEPPADELYVPQFYVYTDGDDVILASRDQGDVQTLYDGFDGPERESAYVGLAVKPGSTSENLTVVMLSAGEGLFWLEYVTVTDRGEPQFATFPDEYQVSGDVSYVPPMPVWSPDGRHLAWLEYGADGTFLRTLGWDGKPGTGRTADDDASFGLDVGAVTLEDWIWTEGTGVETAGRFHTSDCSVLIEIARQGDGALALGAFGGGAGSCVATEIIDSHHNDGAAVGPEYGLIPNQGVIRWSADGDQSGEMTLPDAIADADPSTVWMTARKDGVLIGTGGSAAVAYVIPREPTEPMVLPGQVQYAAFVD